MELIYSSIQTTLDSFDFSFCIAVNVLTYLLVKLADAINGDAKVSTWTKRVILLLSIIAISIVYYYAQMSLKLIINSAILAPVFWSWIFKPLCAKLGIDYKQINID